MAGAPRAAVVYPVLTEPYARQIARDWNTKNGGTGYVTRFEVDAAYGAGHEVHQVGGRDQVLALVLDAEDRWWLGSLAAGELTCWCWYPDVEQALRVL